MADKAEFQLTTSCVLAIARSGEMAAVVVKCSLLIFLLGGFFVRLKD